MSQKRASYRQIFKSTSISGGASLVAIIISLAKMKAFALILGPVGVGLFGAMNAVTATAGAVAALGLGSSGVRELAAAPDEQRRSQVRHAIWRLSLIMAVVGAVSLALLQPILAPRLFEGRASTSDLLFLAATTGLIVLSGTQMVMLQAYRHIADLAQLRVWGALLAAVAGTAFVWQLGPAGIAPAIAAVPLASVLVGWIYLRRLPKPGPRRPDRATTVTIWRNLTKLGAVVMLTGLMGGVAQIAIRALIVRDLDLSAAGLFQAAWSLSVTSLGLILTAMAADYFPRLSALGDDADAQGRLMNEQIHVALLLGVPILAGMIAVAPWLLSAAFSSEFAAAADTFRWQVCGDLLKLVVWAMGFVLLSRADMLSYLGLEALFASTFVILAFFLLPRFGLIATGQAYLGAYLLYFCMAAWRLYARFRVRMSGANMLLLLAGLASVILTAFAGTRSDAAAFVIGGLAAFAFAVYALYQLKSLMLPADMPIAKFLRRHRGAPS